MMTGHALRTDRRTLGRNSHTSRRAGIAVCECGAFSSMLRSTFERRQWHREHLGAQLAGRTRILAVPR